MDLHVRHANTDDIAWIIRVSGNVQEALTATGSQQRIGPLSQDMVEPAVSERHCYILDSSSRSVGCVFVRPLRQVITHSPEGWRLDDFPKPHWYLHSLMLEPEEQRKGLGLHFLAGVIQHIEFDNGTVFLDCWAGNNKLRDFYTRAGFTFLGIIPEKNYEVAMFFLLLNNRK